MGLFDKIFNRKEEEEPMKATESAEQPATLDNEIESIIIILENLGVMKEEDIREKIKDSKYFDESVLKRLQIIRPEGLDSLERYFGNVSFGYGSDKINQIREKLKSVATSKALSNISRLTIIEELIEMAKIEIEAYSKILKHFNNSLKQVEEDAKNNAEKGEQIERWKNYYKEQELGYPIDFDRKIKEMRKELTSLPYGGYGEEEMIKFEEAARKIVEEARLSGEESRETLDRINSDLYHPKKNRYLSDVETLKRKLQMIEESPFLSEFEKEQNKQTTIHDFNVMNGHQEDLNTKLEQLKRNLTLLEYGGYGETVIKQFSLRTETIISDGKRVGKPEEEIKKEVQEEYRKLVDAYQAKLLELKERLQMIDHSSLEESEKEQRKKGIIEDFHDEMGLPIDYEERISSMLWELKELENGGYGELTIESFQQKVEERFQNAKTRTEIRDALRDIRTYQERLIKEYKEELKRLNSAMDRVAHDRHLSPMEKEEAIEDLDRDFKFRMGYRMNFDKYIAKKADELTRFEDGGYGKEAIEEFLREVHTIARSSDSEREKYDKIRQRFQALKKHYYNNIRTFREWKRMQLKGKSKEEKEALEKELNKKIVYMLSLSPQALQDYYLEDDRVRKEAREKHNYTVAFKFLAKQEAREKKNELIYQERLAELELGLKPYTADELEDAENELKMIAISCEEPIEEEQLISLVEYIDSTLLRQMKYAEATILKTSSN